MGGFGSGRYGGRSTVEGPRCKVQAGSGGQLTRVPSVLVRIRVTVLHGRTSAPDLLSL